MNHSTRSIFMLLFGILAVAGHSLAQTRSANPDKMAARLSTAINSLNRLPERTADDYTEQIVRARPEILEALLRNLEGATTPHQKCRALCILGFYRYEEAIPALVKNLRYQAPREVIDSLPSWGVWPAVHALSRIGEAALGPMIEVLETSDDEQTRVHAVRVIQDIGSTYVEGSNLKRELVYTLSIMQQAIDTQTDPKKKQRLRDALKYFEKD